MSNDHRPGITSSLRQLATSLAALAHNRVELASTEIQLAARLAVLRLAWTLAAVGLALITLAMLSALVLVVAWDSHRIAAAVGLTLFYGGGTLGCWLMARRISRRSPPLLSGTIGELKSDVARLRGQP